jgi:hypothetical protein
MSIQLIFWMLMILWAIFGVIPIGNAQVKLYGNTLLLFVLLALLGWRVFGAAVHQ